MNIKMISKKVLLGILNSFIIIIFNKEINNIINDAHEFYFVIGLGGLLILTITNKINIRKLVIDIVLYSIPYYFTVIVILLFKGVLYKIILLIVIGQMLVAYLMAIELFELEFKNKNDKVAYRLLYLIVLFTSIVFCVVKEINEGVTTLIVLVALTIYCTISYIIYTNENAGGGESYE